MLRVTRCKRLSAERHFATLARWRPVERTKSLATPAKPHDLATAGRTTKCVFRTVEHVHERECPVIAPKAKNLARRAEPVRSHEAAAVEEVQMLVVSVSGAAVAEQRVKARAMHPHRRVRLRSRFASFGAPERKCSSQIAISSRRTYTRPCRPKHERDREKARHHPAARHPAKS